MQKGDELLPGIETSFSIRSAKTLKAKAFAFAPACKGVTPYASTPGISEISAIHRPSSSCSNSISKFINASICNIVNADLLA
jgi:hypothetical protein